MKRSRIFLIPLALIFAGCIQVEEPEIKEVRNFRVENLYLSDVRIGFSIVYYNPNDFSVTVKETEVKVYIDAVLLGNFVQDTSVDVNKRGDFTIPLTGQIPVATVLQLDLKDIHKRTVQVQAEGTTKVGKGGIFITRRVQYKGQHRLSDLRL